MGSEGSSPDRQAQVAVALQGKKVILCVSGGIAAYKAVYLARSLTLLGGDVRVVMTEAAQRFVGAQTFAGVTGNPVVTELFTDAPFAPTSSWLEGPTSPSWPRPPRILWRR